MALMEEKGISAVAVVGARDGAIVGNFSISELRWVLGGGGWVGLRGGQRGLRLDMGVRWVMSVAAALSEGGGGEGRR